MISRQVAIWVCIASLVMNPLYAQSEVDQAVESPITIDWDPQSHESIRNYYGSCTSYLCPPLELEEGRGYVSDSVGIPMGPGDQVEEFNKRMQVAISERGLEALRGSSVYVAGVDLHKEAELQSQYHRVLLDLGFEEGDVDLVLWSVPSEVMATNARVLTKTLFDRIRYWLPSKRDYEKPIASEVVTAFAASVVMELPNLFFLRDKIENSVDFGLTLLAHFTILSTYNVFSKTFINWFARPRSSAFESYAKQMTFASLFVASYSVFPYSTEIISQLRQDITATLSELPSELGRVLAEQSLTAPLQTLFITAIMSWVIGPWTNSQNGEQNSRDARVFRQIAPLPILAWGAVAFAKASGVGDAATLIDAGVFEVNSGHVELLVAAGTGYVAYKYLMDPAFSVYKFLKYKSKTAAVRSVNKLIKPFRVRACSESLKQTDKEKR